MTEAFRRATRNARALFGATNSVVILRSEPRDLRFPDVGGQPPHDNYARSVMDSGKSAWFEDACEADGFNLARTRKLGIRLYVAAPIRTSDGEIRGVICVVDAEPRPYDRRLMSLLEDLAASIGEAFDRVMAVERQRELTQKAESAVDIFSSLVRSLPMGFVMTDREMRIIKANARWSRAFGRDPDQLVGVSLYEVSDYFRQFSEQHKLVLQGESAHHPRMAFKMGADAIYVDTRVAPWRASNGEVGGVFVTAFDVTSLVETLERLERFERRLQIAVQLADLHVYEIDYAKQSIDKVGDDTFFERPMEFADIAADAFAVIHPDDREYMRAAFASTGPGEAHSRIACRANRSDGKEVWMTSSAEVVRDDKGAVTRVIGVLQNVTAAKMAEQALIAARDEADAANRAKSDFLANMSHEIRTPLNGVLGMAQVIEAGELSDEQRERVAVIRESGATLLAILNDVLDLSKIQAGKFELNAAAFDMCDVVRTVASAFSGAAAAKDLALWVDIDPSCEGGWTGDALRVRQVLSNLVSNALKFTEQGEVRILARVEDGEIALSVRDTGIGIAADKIGELFDKFTQADASTTRRFGGTGLGLSISSELAALMGGRIEAVSCIGEGSTFTFRAPLERCDLPARTVADKAASPSPERALRILAAEDNPTNQLVLRSLLAPLGADVTVVGDGARAVEAFKTGDFDIVLMDIQMPVMNGVEACVALRAFEAASGRPRTPILALSANIMSHQIEEYLAAGMDGSIAKPIEVERLYTALDEVLIQAETDTALKAAG